MKTVHKATIVPIVPLEGAKRIGPPEWAGNVVAMIEFQGRIHVACQFGVFRLNGDVFEPIMFVNQPHGTLTDTPAPVPQDG